MRSRSASRQDDRRVLAAQLQHHRRQVLGCRDHHLAAGGHAAREHDLFDARVLDQRLREGVACGDHVAHAGREPGLLAQLAELQADERRRERGLQHHRVAGGERRRDPGERQEEGVVPRRDHEHDAVRLVDDPAILVRREQQLACHRLVAQQVGGFAGEMLQRFERGEDLDRVRLGERLALFLRDQLGDDRGLRQHCLAQPRQVASAFVVAQRSPRGERPARGIEGLARLGSVEQRDRSEGPAGRRADCLAASAAAWKLLARDPGVMSGRDLGVRRFGGGRDSGHAGIVGYALGVFNETMASWSAWSPISTACAKRTHASIGRSRR